MTRENAGLFDETSFNKIEVRGPGALAFLNYVCANDIDQPVGSVVYTECLNKRGGIECDFTVTRLAEERFLIITGTAFGQHDISWLRLNMPEDGSVAIEDVGSLYACIGLWGPKARKILQKVTEVDLSNEAFSYMTARNITVGDVPVVAMRVTYVGELGWEFYCPMEYGLRLWDITAGGLIIECAGGEFWHEPIPGRDAYRIIANNGRLRRQLEKLAG